MDTQTPPETIRLRETTSSTLPASTECKYTCNQYHQYHQITSITEIVVSTVSSVSYRQPCTCLIATLIACCPCTNSSLLVVRMITLNTHQSHAHHSSDTRIHSSDTRISTRCSHRHCTSYCNPSQSGSHISNSTTSHTAATHRQSPCMDD